MFVFVLQFEHVFEEDADYSFLATLTDEQRTGHAEDQHICHHQHRVVTSPKPTHLQYCSLELGQTQGNYPRGTQQQDVAD